MRRGGSAKTRFAEAFLGDGVDRNRKLARIASVLHWGPVGTLTDKLRSSRFGRPPYAPLVMVHLLLLQQL